MADPDDKAHVDDEGRENAPPGAERPSPEPGLAVPPMPREFRHFLAMVQGQFFRPNPLLEKLDTDGVKQLLTQSEKSNERDHKRQMHHMYLLAALGAIGMVATIGLCYMFLVFNKSDQVEKIIALMIGLAGGFGLGRGTAPKALGDKE